MSAMSASHVDMTRTLLLHDAPEQPLPAAPAASDKSGLVRIEEYLPNRVRLTVEAARRGLVLLSDNFFPGWEATLDGRPTKILRSWFTFRAVEVPAGRSLVEFVYRPVRLWLAVALSSVLALVWLALYTRARPRLLTVPAVAFAVPKKSKKSKKRGEPVVLPLDDDPVLTAACGRCAERLLLILIGCGLLFWTLWGGFVYKGDRWINVVAWAALLAEAGLVCGAGFKKKSLNP
jgi:hypothetical protein